MGVMTTETRMAAAILLEKDVARVCAWLLKTPTLEWESHYHRHFDELHYYRLFYDVTQEKRPRHLNESIITTDGLMSFVTTDFCMTTAFQWLETRVWVWLLQTQTLGGESHYHRHNDGSELHYYRLSYDSCISVTQDTCMRLITKDPDT